MLRLRFTDAPPGALGPTGLLHVAAATCNESGSIVRLEAPLPLRLQVVDSATLAPVSGAKVTAVPAAGSATSSRQLTTPCVDVSGHARLALCVTGATKPFRLLIEAAAQARLQPLSSSFDGGASSRGGASTAATLLAVCSVHTPVVTPAGTKHQQAPFDAAAHAIKPEACELLTFRHCGRELRVLEQQNAVRGGFGSIVWDCALLLAAVLEANAATLMRGKRVVDVGSGTGFVALAAANGGAHVVATDLSEMLGLTALNVALNAGALRAGGGTVACMPLPWGLDARTASAEQLLAAIDPLDAAAAAAAVTAAAAAAASGPPRRVFPTAPVGATAGIAKVQPPLLSASATFQPPYDLVLASEVAYRTEVFPALLLTLRSLCAPQRTHVLLAARRRACCDLAELLRAASEHFSITLLAGEVDDAVAAWLDTPAVAVAAAGPGGGAPPFRPTGKPQQRAAHAAAAAAGDGSARPFASIAMPLAVSEFARGAAALSKTSFAPLLFGLALK